MVGKAELVKIISDKTGTTKKRVAGFIYAFVNKAADKLAAVE